MNSPRELDISRFGPSTELEVWEIQGLINRLRRASVAASCGTDDRQWEILRDALKSLGDLHRYRVGDTY